MVLKMSKVVDICMTQWLKGGRVEVSCNVTLGKIVFIPCEIIFQPDQKNTQKYIKDLQLIKNGYKIRPYK